ncbi:MAG: trypsin-like peptidase domain-containing protein, partial [Coriobacteriia bacterium]|nr:trypsin-like peptidase domain-containing protein [Coriobacteriia bacterium]
APAQESRQIELVGDQTEEIVAAAASVALPSVVNVDITGEQADSGSLPSDHPSVPIQGEGSGVAYQEAPDGGTYIITNNHVVDGATTIVVTDSAGERHDAELVGGDSESDIAVIKVVAPIPTIGIGDSENLVVGQLAIAIGSPFGLEHSVTSGVVSAVHRPLTNIGDSDGRYPYVDSIQTDAAINPGNSGGALVDRRGLLIGIPSAIYSDTGSYDGVGLAIPVQTAVRAAGELIEKGRVDTPFLGILGQTVTPAFAEQEALPVTEGAWVAEVTAGTEAEKAGLQTGDVIVALNDARIRSMDDLILIVRRQSVGDQVSLTIWRDGDEMTIEMMIGIKPQDLTTE